MALDTRSTGRLSTSDFRKMDKSDPRRQRWEEVGEKAHAQDMNEHNKNKYSSASRHQSTPKNAEDVRDRIKVTGGKLNSAQTYNWKDRERSKPTTAAGQIFSTVGKIAKDRAKGGSDNRSAAVDAASRYQNTGLSFNKEAKEWQHRDTGKAATGEERAGQVRHYGAYTEKGRAGIGYSGTAPTKHEKGSDAYYGQEFGQSHARGSAWTEHQQKLDPTLDTKGLRSKWIEQRRAFDTAGAGGGDQPVRGINPPKKGPGHGKGINPGPPKKGKRRKKGPRPDMPSPQPPAYVHPWDRDDWGAGDREKIGLAPLPKPPVGAPGGTPKPPIRETKKPGFPGGTPKPKPDRGGMFRPGAGFPGGPPLYPEGPGRRPPMFGGGGRGPGRRPPMFGGGRRPPMYGGGRRPPMFGGGRRPPMFGGGRGPRPPMYGGGRGRPPMFGGGRGPRPPMFGGGRRPPMFGGGGGLPPKKGGGFIEFEKPNVPNPYRGEIAGDIYRGQIGWGRVKNRR